jgi:putative oxidoreductase
MLMPSQQHQGRLTALSARYSQLEDRIASLIRPYSLSLLRVSLGVVFLWFGALKVADATPVAALIAGAVPWVDPSWFVPFLGVVEVLLGIALIIGRWLTAVSAALAGHLSGTFLVLLMQPQVAFQHGNPLLLTTEGEFVIKNVVLISAALVLASRLREPLRTA